MPIPRSVSSILDDLGGLVTELEALDEDFIDPNELNSVYLLLDKIFENAQNAQAEAEESADEDSDDAEEV